MIGRFLMPQPIANGQIFRITDLSGQMYNSQVSIYRTLNNKIDWVDSVLCWTNNLSREYVYMGDGTNGYAVCITQCITNNPGS